MLGLLLDVLVCYAWTIMIRGSSSNFFIRSPNVNFESFIYTLLLSTQLYLKIYTLNLV